MWDVLSIALAFFAGLALGTAYFRALGANVALYVTGEATGRALALHGLRLVGAGVVFFAAAQFGAGPLLGVLAGFVVARLLLVRARRTSVGEDEV